MPSNRSCDSATNPTDSTMIREKMSRLRAELATEIDSAKQQASEFADWRSYVRKHPLATVGVVAAAAYLLVPKRSNIIQLSDKQLTTLAKQGGVNVTTTTTGNGNASPLKAAVMAVGAFAVRSALQHVATGLKERGNATSPSPDHVPPPVTES